MRPCAEAEGLVSVGGGTGPPLTAPPSLGNTKVLSWESR